MSTLLGEQDFRGRRSVALGISFAFHLAAGIALAWALALPVERRTIERPSTVGFTGSGLAPFSGADTLADTATDSPSLIGAAVDSVKTTWLFVKDLTASAFRRKTAAPIARWSDRSNHSIRFVTVDEDVQLEVLDWGGTGGTIVLLAGIGSTAHIFDNLAPKLTDCCHVVGITRRGHGASSQPPAGYDDQRLADDVLKVLEAQEISTPILVGHSSAGNEMTRLANQHSKRFAGLVYLDAVSDPLDAPALNPAYRNYSPDYSSFHAYRLRQLRDLKFAFPESEVRSMFTANPDGTVGRYKTPLGVFKQIGEGLKRRDYSQIRLPVLAVQEIPPTSADGSATEDSVRRGIERLKRGVPDARVVDLPGAGPYSFLTQESRVLDEIHRFVSSVSP